MSLQPIIFYDLHNTKPTAETRAWSPNTFKTRYSLGFKGLPFTTVWVEYPDISALYKEIGAEPTDTNDDGSPYYSLPVIQDPNTRAVVVDSWKIAEYLDTTYPDRPTLIPAGTKALQWAFGRAAVRTACMETGDLARAATCGLLAPRSQAFFRATRVVPEFTPAGRAAHWAKAEAGFALVGQWIDKEPGPWVMGAQATWVDLVLASWIVWVRQVDGETWEHVVSWEGGRWAKFVDGLSEYAKFDEGELYQSST